MEKSNNKSNERTSAGSAGKQAGDATSQDGLKLTRENSATRQEVRQQKSSQGQPNRG